MAVCHADPNDCDGTVHVCWDCGGEGWIEEDDGLEIEERTCQTCRGRGGWPCPAATQSDS